MEKNGSQVAPPWTRNGSWRFRVLGVGARFYWKHYCVSRRRFGRRTNSCSTDLTTASAERSQVQHSEREDLMSSSSQGLNFKFTAEPVALFSHQSSMNQDVFSKREQLVDVLGSNQSIFRFSYLGNVAKSLLDGNRDNLLTQIRSELMKQEQKVESLNNCIYELQQQACAQRLELEDVHHGYVESRREQVRLLEELVMKDKALRDTQIKSMHEMGLMKRAQELRVDEFSKQKLRECHETNRGSLHKYKNYRKRMNCLNDPDQFHTFPVNQQGFQDRALCYAATNACLLSHEYHLDHRKSFLQIHVRHLSYHKYLIEEFISLRHRVIQVRFRCTQAQVSPVTREEERIGSTIPIPTTMNFFVSVDMSQSSMNGQQRQQISELQFDKFLLHHHLYVGRQDSEIRWLLVLIFPRKLCYGSKKWRWTIHWTN